MQIVIERAAQADIRRIIRFYEKCESGAGGYFLDHFRQEAPRLLNKTEHLRKRLGFFFIQMRRFPIGIYFRIQGEVIQICAVLDLRGDPQAIREQLGLR